MYRFIHPDVQMNVKKPLFFLVAFTDVETINQQYSLNSSSNRLFTIERLWCCLSILITFWSVAFQEWHCQKQLTLTIEVHLIEPSYVC